MEASGGMKFRVPGREPKWRYRQVPRAAHIPLPHRVGLCRIPRLYGIGFIRFAVMYFQSCSEDDLGKGLHTPTIGKGCLLVGRDAIAHWLSC